MKNEPIRLPEELRLELLRLHTARVIAEQHFQTALSVAEKALGLPKGAGVNLDDGTVVPPGDSLSD